jgi:hypothetical protein
MRYSVALRSTATRPSAFLWYDQNYFHNPQQIVSADCAMSLDVVFHLIEDDVFAGYIRNLFCCGRRFVIIYGLDQDDVQRGHVSVRYRKYSDYIAENIPGFRVADHAPRTDKFGDFYLYERVSPVRLHSAAWSASPGPHWRNHCGGNGRSGPLTSFFSSSG